MWLVQLEQTLHRTVPEVLQAEPTEAIVVHRAIILIGEIKHKFRIDNFTQEAGFKMKMRTG